MKIVLIGLASVFTEGMTYQDNLLANQLRYDGHEITIISECYKYQDGVIVKTHEEDKVLPNGIHLVRIKYRNILGDFISGKIRAVKGLYNILEQECPDIIFHHGLQSYELLTIVKYKKKHTDIKIFLDSHEDFNNSATNFLSKYILHKMYYKYIIRRVLPYIDKVFCVAYESFDFLRQLYGVPDNLMEFYPLGGIILDESIREEKRIKIRKKLMLKNANILMVHSGKMDKLKRTDEIIKAFMQVKSDKFRLLLIGTMQDDVKKDIFPLIESDNRIKFLGWKNGDELLNYLCACDLYVQPGTQSATMQNALCCGSAAALYPYSSHKYLLKDSVFYIETINDMMNLFDDISRNPEILEKKQIQSNKLAHEILDYRVLASRLFK
ncbi:hypothetical protein psyc5s11_50870 [Clostridium gelidum]|uniref:Glycosyltransferase subfamily 4-like N-terminal domain-containing protein n=1 Tax=Clostridium gelidum TaxID=704125 RepID=A0ABM7TAQ4_9CLOT|nr:glycosyltransferase family 4 protein [Clostridium gelidum]BCZ49020.1 hypothetical protein psyc5s11_50870 [Clostridium gelidum]